MLKQWLHELLTKWSCHHDWELVHENDVYEYECDKYPIKIVSTFMCKKCGKFKKIKL